MSKIKSATVNVRISEDVKNTAENILNKLGLSRATAIDLFYRQIIINNGLPFEVKIPSLNQLSKEKLYHIFETGLEQALNDEGISLAEAFEQLNRES